MTKSELAEIKRVNENLLRRRLRDPLNNYNVDLSDLEIVFDLAMQDEYIAAAMLQSALPHALPDAYLQNFCAQDLPTKVAKVKADRE